MYKDPNKTETKQRGQTKEKNLNLVRSNAEILLYIRAAETAGLVSSLTIVNTKKKGGKLITSNEK